MAASPTIAAVSTAGSGAVLSDCCGDSFSVAAPAAAAAADDDDDDDDDEEEDEEDPPREDKVEEGERSRSASVAAVCRAATCDRSLSVALVGKPIT